MRFSAYVMPHGLHHWVAISDGYISMYASPGGGIILRWICATSLISEIEDGFRIANAFEQIHIIPELSSTRDAIVDAWKRSVGIFLAHTGGVADTGILPAVLVWNSRVLASEVQLDLSRTQLVLSLHQANHDTQHVALSELIDIDLNGVHICRNFYPVRLRFRKGRSIFVQVPLRIRWWVAAVEYYASLAGAFAGVKRKSWHPCRISYLLTTRQLACSRKNTDRVFSRSINGPTRTRYIGTVLTQLQAVKNELRDTARELRQDSQEFGDLLSRGMQTTKRLQTLVSQKAAVVDILPLNPRTSMNKTVTGLTNQHAATPLSVYCRIRPRESSEERLFDSVSEQALTLSSGRQIRFHRVFQNDALGHSSTLVEICMERIRLSAVSSFIAVGPSGTGKTRTLASPFGLVARINKEYPNCRVSCLELYNDVPYDPIGARRVKVHTDSSNRWSTTPALLEAKLTSDLMSRLLVTHRASGITELNATSSRSHLFIRIVTGTGKSITLVDLAGSENVARSGVSGESLREAKSINKSLAVLGHICENLLRQGTGEGGPLRTLGSKLGALLACELSKQKVAMIVHLRDSITEAASAAAFLNLADRMMPVKPCPGDTSVKIDCSSTVPRHIAECETGS